MFTTYMGFIFYQKNQKNGYQQEESIPKKKQREQNSKSFLYQMDRPSKRGREETRDYQHIIWRFWRVTSITRVMIGIDVILKNTKFNV